MSAVSVLRTVVAAGLCLALAACTMGPDFVRPQAELPSHWQGEVVAEVGMTGRATGPHLDWRMNLFDVRLDPQLLAPPMAAASD